MLLFDLNINDSEELKKVNGMQYIANFINQEEADILIKNIDNSDWLGDLKRRVQHYGFKYDYRSRSINESMRVQDIPHWCKFLTNRLYDNEWLLPADQMIVNEYLPGQGISAHVDCEPCFLDTIVSVSLLSPCVMIFRHKVIGESVEVYLEPNSAVVLRGDSRYKWTHEIPARKTVKFKGKNIKPRARRVSLTFRQVNLDRD